MKKALFFSILAVVLFAGPALAERLTVVVDKANIRSGPGKNYDVLWSVGKYYPVETIKKSGQWYKIRDFEDDEGWVFHTLLGKTPSLIIKAPLVNIRQGPGTKTKVVFQAEKGVSFKRIGTKEPWFKVQHSDGEVGWIHKSLVWGY
jgi:SH3-like domain-containing protein